jgi:outer membrane protein OmpA-like peptidoglycan-associated protein
MKFLFTKSKTIPCFFTAMFLMLFVPFVANAMQIFVETSLGKHRISLEVNPADRIETVKAKIQSKVKILPQSQILTFDGQTLKDGNSLRDYNIQQNNKIYFTILFNLEKVSETFEKNSYYTWDGMVLTIKDGTSIIITGTVSNGRRVVVTPGAVADITLRNLNINTTNSAASAILTPPAPFDVTGATVHVNFEGENVLSPNRNIYGEMYVPAVVSARTITVAEKKILEEDIEYDTSADAEIAGMVKELEAIMDTITLPKDEKQAEEVVKSIIDKYGKGGANLTLKQENQLEKKIILLNAYPQMQILCIGHSSDEGNSRVGFAIGLLRANVVRDYLIGHGIASSRVFANSKGDKQPIAPNTTEENKLKNRRVEINLVENNAPVAAKVPTPAEKEVLDIVIDGYKINSALSPEQKNKLNNKIALFNKYPDMQILCIGHTCDKGSDKTNFAIGQSRAQEVKDYLIQHGISSSRIQTKSMGNKEPLMPNINEKNRLKNRRVEIQIR